MSYCLGFRAGGLGFRVLAVKVVCFLCFCGADFKVLKRVLGTLGFNLC